MSNRYHPNKTKRRRRKSQRVSRRTNVFVERMKALQRADVPTKRLLLKPEVMAITGVSFPTLWQWMRDGKFPRSRIVEGRSMWLTSEIDAWITSLPLRPLKGDTPADTDEAA